MKASTEKEEVGDKLWNARFYHSKVKALYLVNTGSFIYGLIRGYGKLAGKLVVVSHLKVTFMKTMIVLFLFYGLTTELQ